MISFYIKLKVVLHVSGATHASLPVPWAHSAELHCRVDVSGCEWLQIDENPGHSGRVLFFDYFQLQFEIGFIYLFIYFHFQFGIDFYLFIKLDRGPPATMRNPSF